MADEIVVGRAYVEELSADTELDDTEQAAADDPILEAIEARDLCTQRLSSALAIIMLLTPGDSGDDTATGGTAIAVTSTTIAATTNSSGEASSSTSNGTSAPSSTDELTTNEPTINGAASELKDRAIDLYDAELNVLKAEPRGEPFVSTARSRVDPAEAAYNAAVERFVEVAGADTREGPNFLGTRGWAIVAVIGAVLLAGGAAWLSVWLFRRRRSAVRTPLEDQLSDPAEEAQEGDLPVK